MTSLISKNPKPKKNRNQYGEFEDAYLIKLIGQQRDGIALAEIYERYRLTLGRFLLSGMPHAKLVDEIYNDVMLAVWRNASNFRGDSKVSTWLFGIAFRARMNASRKESKHNHMGDEVLENEESQHANVIVSETMRAAILGLSDAHKIVIELAYFHGYNTIEIAAIVDCPQNTVKTRLFHARKKLKASLEYDHSFRGSEYEI